jgi:hypothetical protein
MNDSVVLKVRTPSGISELNVIELLEVNGNAFIPVGDLTERLAFLEGRLSALETQFTALLAVGG